MTALLARYAAAKAAFELLNRDTVMNKYLIAGILSLIATSADAACNRAYIEAAIDQRVPSWATKFRSSDRVNNICTLCGGLSNSAFRACAIAEVDIMAGRAHRAARRVFGVPTIAVEVDR